MPEPPSRSTLPEATTLLEADFPAGCGGDLFFSFSFPPRHYCTSLPRKGKPFFLSLSFSNLLLLLRFCLSVASFSTPWPFPPHRSSPVPFLPLLRPPPLSPSRSLSFSTLPRRLCSSIPLSWDLAREPLSSYIEKSGGRVKNRRYLYHLLCALPLLPAFVFRAKGARVERKNSACI